MKKLVIVLLSILTVILLVGIWGGFLSPTFSRTYEIKLNQPVGVVWQQLNAWEGVSVWHPDVMEVEAQQVPEGLSSKWKIVLERNYAMVVEAIELEQNALLSVRVGKTNLPFSANWIADLKPFGLEEERTLFTLTEKVESENPYVRVWLHLRGAGSVAQGFLHYFAASLGQENIQIIQD